MENEGKRKEMKSKMKGNQRYPAGYERVMEQHERKRKEMEQNERKRRASCERVISFLNGEALLLRSGAFFKTIKSK